MSYIHFLKKNNTSWRPSYVRNYSDFTNTVASYRSKWRDSNRNSRSKIETNFKKKYNSWLAKVRQMDAEKRKTNQYLFEKIRQARKTGNNSLLSRLLNKTPSRLSAPARSGKSRDTKSLFKKMHNARLRGIKNDMRSRINALELQRNNLERQINSIRVQLRELPV